jgi:hypothetical protein
MELYLRAEIFMQVGTENLILLDRDALYVVSGDRRFGNIALISTYALKMEAVPFSETLITTYQTARSPRRLQH